MYGEDVAKTIKKPTPKFKMPPDFDDSVFNPKEDSRASFDRGYANGESDGFAGGVVFTVVVLASAAAFFWFVCRHV